MDGTTSAHESARLRALHRLAVLDTPREQLFDDLVALAAHLVGTPMAALSLIDGQRQWFKSTIGFELTQTPRAVAFCDHVVRSGKPLVVQDARDDARFASNPFVTEEGGIRFYVGVPVFSSNMPIGALCAMAPAARGLDAEHLDRLHLLARQVEQLLELRWRRSIAAPPQQQTMEHAARTIRGQDSFARVTDHQFRPAWVYELHTLRILDVNDAAIEQYGWSREQWLQMTILDLRSPQDATVLEVAIRNSHFGDCTGKRVWQHLRADGSTFDVNIASTPVTFAGRAARFVVASDVTAKLHSEDILIHASLHDQLTGLPNRRYFLDTLTRIMSVGDRAAALLTIGIDRFKLMNDSAGHDIGDALLAAVSARLSTVVSSSELVARLGGDEFGVVLAGAAAADSTRVAQRVLDAITEPVHVEGGEFYLTASAGIAVVHEASTARSVLAEADVAMSAAKRNGGNTMVVFDDNMRQEIDEWSAVQRDLRWAIERDEFELEYQPVIDLVSGSVSFEALIRWNHPTRGRLLPDAFIPVAEESGLIRQLGRWVLATSARAAAELDADVSINVSVHQFNDALVADFEHAIADTRLRPGQLIVEVTESALIDITLAQCIVNRLRSLGARIWIDDFGTGYSSLHRLSELTVDALKLDRSFVANTDTAQGIAIATSVINLGRGLGVQVVAEGIETAEQLALLTALGCHAAQGYYLGRPMSLAAARQLAAPTPTKARRRISC
jgi:diguanylate cyclase (GGDEF)-like protein/PAS domain S-box-containing protein